ncbi:MAG: glycosyltransferase [Patescibacteria group bacterium]|jgi:glycosyltransferase involved in cell wall biosynthesis
MKSISAIIPSLNEAKLLSTCLKSIRTQNYDQAKIEILVADGGSKDGTKAVCRKYKAHLLKDTSGSPEASKGLALKHAKNELVLVLDCDNVLPQRNWLRDMVSAFNKEPDIVGCYTWRYTLRKTDNPLNRYFALFGANDPVAYFLGKADRQSYLSDSWNLMGEIVDKGSYFVVSFTPKTMPTLGANGFLTKRKYLLKAKSDGDWFYHTCVNLDLISQGLNRYVVMKNDVVHASGENLLKYLQKRKKYLEQIYLRDQPKRRYLVYDPQKDTLKIVAFSVYSLSIILPTLVALWGFLKVKDIAWFFHPVICFALFWIYTYATLKSKLGTIFEKLDLSFLPYQKRNL